MKTTKINIMNRLEKRMARATNRLSMGNRKLKATKNDPFKFLIWNLPAVVTCPYRTAQCESLCYARKAERVYKNVLPFRHRNLELANSDGFVDHMVNNIRWHAQKPSFMGKRIYFRIHESGDYYTKQYLLKWLEVANRIAEYSDIDIVFLSYTKSIRFFEGVELPSNFVVRYSVWDDTKLSEIAVNKKLGFSTFTAETKENIKATKKFTCGGDCNTCKTCYSAKVNVACEIH